MSKAPTTRARGSRAKRHLRIFLNYRREDSSGHAGRLYDDLAEQRLAQQEAERRRLLAIEKAEKQRFAAEAERAQAARADAARVAAKEAAHEREREAKKRAR